MSTELATNPEATQFRTIEHTVRTLPVDASIDRMAEARFLVDGLKAFVKELDAQLDERFLEIVTERGPVEIGDIKYYAGTKKTTRCTDVSGAIQALLNATGGDFESLCRDFLASQPVKYGAAKEPLGDAWSKFFTVEEEPELKEGKPVKRLQKTNTKFLT